ncbi:amino acid ABC transporter substrate-binding protein [Rhizobium pusense]|uniref:Periplasmic substrate binding protein (Amino acid/opine) putative receptor subunit of signal transduction protein n=1 Tax=Agrobacterium genomosp. 2 str. CFBP 5494 TaxID=1183436 RepID=A0A9W5F5Z8_9HYPH|nr:MULTISPECIES: amino acid ABC transporter substrate-binding protein [Agrobacterium]MDH2087901.1 amino acid ABC transporter substrate-binding protein [Agrobacterium pusense]MRG63969.1 transporter substrate-binding domain-containing protein [Agrobacterium pusense]WCK25884.1 amino acid ABC transporter substrate-binding protein [Agrobacterium pusense]CUW97936.1 putative periplasmic substrate binding protein (amino acid/opine); putative receptor subunit of signal transduction protein [Agrobacteriu
MQRSTLWLALGIFSLLSTYAAGQEVQPPTLETIARTGIIRLGYADRNIPFSYLGTGPEPIGYSIELCLKVVDSIREKLDLPGLKVDFVKRTPSNRITLLNDGTIDMECVASTNTEERRKAVWFSYSHFITGTRYVALKSSGLNTVADLAGRTVVVTTGTINISQLNVLNRKLGLNIAVLQNDSTEGGFEMVTENRASAFVMDDILLRSFVAETGRPEDYAISNEYLAPPQPYGLMLRHGDTGFRDAVNEALGEIYASGEIDKIYEKWFNAPIPPNGMNLQRPLPDDLADAFRNPVDTTAQ